MNKTKVDPNFAFGNIYHLYRPRSAFLALVGLRKIQSLDMLLIFTKKKCSQQGLPVLSR